MKAVELKKNLYWVGMKDPDLKVFDIIMTTEHGTTYNAYVLKGSEKVALFETVKHKFFDDYLEMLMSIIDVEKIDYIVVNHTEPDHAGSIEKLLSFSPKAKIVGSSTALKFVRNIANRPFEGISVNSGDVLSLGDQTIRFISAPFLHWPDSIYSYWEEGQTLFTCDSFGAHYCFEGLLYSQIAHPEDYKDALKYYFEMIMGPFKPHLLKAIEKIDQVPYDMICTGHGPVLDRSPRAIVELWRQWATEVNPNAIKTVVIPYVSAYGYTAELADYIAKGIISAGNLKVQAFDLSYADQSEVLEALYWADGVLLGSPTINSEALPPIWNLLSTMTPITHSKKLASAFGSFGWSGEAVNNISDRLKQLRMEVIPGFKVNFKPTEDDLSCAYKFGNDFGERLLGLGTVAVLNPINRKEKFNAGDGTIKKWRCVICNEIFEGTEPPEVCPACGASEDQFEIYEEVVNQVEAVSGAAIVIVGNNAAGTAACEAIRKRSVDAGIILISSENDLGYYRPMLSDYISASHNEKRFYLHDMTWYTENYIQLRLGTTVRQIDVAHKYLITNEGEKIYYDKLILANGSRNILPPITDIQLPGIFSLKTKDDADAIIQYATEATKLVVIGGGVLGLEVAWEVKNLGLEVVVVEVMDRLLPRQLDLDASKIFERGVINSGVSVIKSVKVSAMIGHEKVTGVQLIDGSMIDCDMVIVSTGIAPNREIAVAAGIKANRGIIVDEHMRTNIADIYAAGDVAEYKGQSHGLWPVAVEQGKIAGANAVGDSLSYNPSLPSTVFNGMDQQVFSIGDVSSFETKGYDAVVEYDRKTETYKKLYFDREGIYVGGILMGDTKKSLAMIRSIEKRVHKEDMIQLIFVK